MALLEVNDLHVVYEQKRQPDVEAVNGVSFTIDENEDLGLVGESGSGKSTIAQAILQSLPKNGRIVEGEVIFDGVDLTELSMDEIKKIRWRDISFIPQSAMASLDPVYTIGDQIREAIQTHKKGVTKQESIERAKEVFEFVGIEPERVHDYPHQLSGGMRQRAIIAMALALDPKLIIADEPTTALDVIVQGQILSKIAELQEEINSSMLMITHDISVVAETCDKMAVMYAGQLMESGSIDRLFGDAKHPYTLGLQNAFPSIEKERQDLFSIPGSPPDLTEPLPGCPFKERCPFSDDVCGEPLPEVRPAEQHLVRCHEPVPFEEIVERSKQKETWQPNLKESS